MNSRLDHLQKMLRDQPNDSFLLFALAKEHEKNGELKKAMIVYEKLRKNDPDYVGLYYHLAALYAESEQPQLAKKTYEDGIKVAGKQNDQHALAELKNAFVNFELEN